MLLLDAAFTNSGFYSAIVQNLLTRQGVRSIMTFTRRSHWPTGDVLHKHRRLLRSRPLAKPFKAQPAHEDPGKTSLETWEPNKTGL